MAAQHSSQINVRVVAFGDRQTYQLQWTDPTTGRKKTRSTTIVNDGRSKSRREAERAASAMETALEANYASSAKSISWELFRDRYEAEKGKSLAKRTQEKIISVFNSVERHINPLKLLHLTDGAISKYAAKLREDGKSESTIKSMLSHLKAALNWGRKMKLITIVPNIVLPGRAGAKAKGRPISGEEFDRMIAAVPKVIKKVEHADQWVRLLRGLWLSGLRIGEAVNLYWDRSDRIRVDLAGKRPMLWIPAAMEKGNKERQLPITPDFLELLEETPPAERTGQVFPLPSRVNGELLQADRVGKIVCRIGEQAGVVVMPGVNGKPAKFASAHDLRRSFAARWVTKVPPLVLMAMMRHENLTTTMTYYAGVDAERTADAIWDAFSEVKSNKIGNTTENSPQGAANGQSASPYSETT